MSIHPLVERVLQSLEAGEAGKIDALGVSANLDGTVDAMDGEIDLKIRHAAESAAAEVELLAFTMDVDGHRRAIGAVRRRFEAALGRSRP